MYNLSLINSSGVTPFLQTVNDNLMFGWYGNLALIALFLILTLSFSAYTQNFKKSLGISLLMIAVFSIFFKVMGLVQDVTVLICWLGAAVGLMLAMFMPD